MESLKILIPTDFSVQAEYAYLMVRNLEQKIAMQVHFLHILEVPDTVSMDPDGKIQTCGEIDSDYVEKRREIADRKLAALKNSYGDRIQTHLLLGKSIDGILDFAEEQHFDLIVMGTKGSSGVKEALSGSETQRIARRSKIPVLSLMCDRSDLSIDHILLVNNYSQPAAENLTLLKKLITAFNSKVHLLQIRNGKEEVEAIEAKMKTFAELNNLSNYTCHVLSDKDVESGVIHFNQMNDMDIISIGTHGKGGLFHHSETEKLINHLFKPILSFHLNN
jgi:nucleotide-binding universal stress UspA family protein